MSTSMPNVEGKPEFRNYYHCPSDGTSWVAEWSSRCNDRCPVCRAEIEPHDSEDIDS
jgi:hypothetical protein